MAAHRYWRLKFDATPRGFCSCSRLELRNALGGVDLTQGSPGVALDGSHYGGYVPAYAFDRDDSSFWTSGGAADWVGFDFGVGNAYDIIEAVFLGRPGDPSSQEDSPRPGGIEWSDDGAAWTRAFELSPLPVTYLSGTLYTFDAPSGTSLQASEGRTFSVFSSLAAGERMTGARVFAIYNFPSDAEQMSAARVIVPVKRASTMQISETRVFAVVRGRIASPQVRAWTFTLDGHDFYVLRLGDKATIVYDTVSEQWVDWDSAMTDAWRPNTGFTWIGAKGIVDENGNSYGSEIIAGDDTFGLLWILDPYQAFDDAPDPLRATQQLPYDRILSAQSLANGRDAFPCYAIWVSGDNYGLVAQDFTPGVMLETSDDQGRTFTNHGTLTVTPDPATNNPYAWYSLGQITSPGRIFRLTDNGLFTRVDTMEMNDDAG